MIKFMMVLLWGTLLFPSSEAYSKNACLQLYGFPYGFKSEFKYWETPEILDQHIISVGERVQLWKSQNQDLRQMPVPERFLLIQIYRELLSGRGIALEQKLNDISRKDLEFESTYHLERNELAQTKLTQVIAKYKLLLSELNLVTAKNLTLEKLIVFSERYARAISIYPDHFDVEGSSSRKWLDTWIMDHSTDFLGKEKLIHLDLAVVFPTTFLPSIEQFNRALRYGLFLSTSGVERFYNYDKGINRTQSQLMEHDDSHWNSYIKQFIDRPSIEVYAEGREISLHLARFNSLFPLSTGHSKIPRQVQLAAHYLLFHHYHENQYLPPSQAEFFSAIFVRKWSENPRVKYNMSPLLEADLIETFGFSYKQYFDRAMDLILEM